MPSDFAYCESVFRKSFIENVEVFLDYARTRLDVYTQDNALAKRLHDVARKYEEYNYNDVYGM